MKYYNCFSSAGHMYAAKVENLRKLEEEERAKGTRHSVENSTAMFRLVCEYDEYYCNDVIELGKEGDWEC